MAKLKKPKVCRKTGKVSFNDELAAKIALARRVWKDCGEKSYYQCGQHFHLTSMERMSVSSN